MNIPETNEVVRVTPAMLDSWDQQEWAAFEAQLHGGPRPDYATIFAHMDLMVGAKLLVIEGMGDEAAGMGRLLTQGYTSRGWVAMLDQAVSERHSQMRPTILRTSLTKAEWLERYGVSGERIEDRIRGEDAFETDPAKWAPDDAACRDSLRQTMKQQGALQ